MFGNERLEVPPHAFLMPLGEAVKRKAKDLAERVGISAGVVEIEQLLESSQSYTGRLLEIQGLYKQNTGEVQTRRVLMLDVPSGGHSNGTTYKVEKTFLTTEGEISPSSGSEIGLKVYYRESFYARQDAERYLHDEDLEPYQVTLRGRLGINKQQQFVFVANANPNRSMVES